MFSRELFPRIIRQPALDPEGVLFEATNPTEAWRIETLDGERYLLSLLLHQLRSDDIVFDIGACVGVYSLHAARKCRHVYAFEPDSGFQARLRRNIELNGLPNVTVVPVAVLDRNGKIPIYTDGIAGRSPSLRNLGQRESVLVEAHRIDDLIASGKLPKPTVVKMDIEGAELAALRGMQALLASDQRPRLIFIEVHPEFSEAFGDSSDEVLSTITQNGYVNTYHAKRDKQEHYVFQTKVLNQETSSPVKTHGLWLLAPGITDSELNDLQARIHFYAPEIKDVRLVADSIPSEILQDNEPILLFCDPAIVPAVIRQQTERVFNIDYRSNPHDGWEWTRLTQCLARSEPDLIQAKGHFTRYVQMLQTDGLNQTYIFGTGPSLEKAIERDWSHGYRIVCNTIVRDPELWHHINPHFIVAGDAIYHFGHTAFAHAFRRDLAARLSESETYFVYPSIFDAIVRQELGKFGARLIPIPVGTYKRIDVDLSQDFLLPGLGNVLSLLLLPLACTLTKDIYMWGFDGRAPDDEYFWSNSVKHTYLELLPELQKAHPRFFGHHVPKDDPYHYVRQVHGDVLETVLIAAERRGFRFIMMHKTWTPTLQKRMPVSLDSDIQAVEHSQATSSPAVTPPYPPDTPTEQILVQRALHLCRQSDSLIARGDLLSALQLLDEAMYTHLGIQNLQYSRALCLWKLSRPEEALIAAKAELKVYPENTRCRELLNEIDRQ